MYNNGNIDSKESGYVIKVTGFHRNGTFYKDGFYGDDFYNSSIGAELYPDIKEANENLERLRKHYKDGTIVFDLCKMTREIKVQVEKCK